MNETDTRTNFDISLSDNSHIWGRPMVITEGFDGYISMPKSDEGRDFDLLSEWIEKTSFLQGAGIEIHLHYSK